MARDPGDQLVLKDRPLSTGKHASPHHLSGLSILALHEVPEVEVEAIAAAEFDPVGRRRPRKLPGDRGECERRVRCAWYGLRTCRSTATA